MKYLTQPQRERYQRDGFLVVDDFLDPSQVAVAKAGIARVCAVQSGLEQDVGGFNLEKVGDDYNNGQALAKRPGLLRKIQGAVFEVPELREVFTGKPMLDCMEDLMGTEIYYHSSKVMFKAPGGAAKPWHQDAAYWPDYGTDQITVWIALDDADANNGCVWAIPGSHRLGLTSHVGDERQIAQGIDLSQAIPVPVKSGGLLIFHSLVQHMSHKNASSRPRCAIICDYDCRPNPTYDGGNKSLAGMDERRVWRLRSAVRA